MTVQPQWIKVRINDRYRLCELLQVYRRRSTGQPGWVDVEVASSDLRSGMSKKWTYVPISEVRHADLPYVTARMIQRYAQTDATRQSVQAALIGCVAYLIERRTT